MAQFHRNMDDSVPENDNNLKLARLHNWNTLAMFDLCEVKYYRRSPVAHCVHRALRGHGHYQMAQFHRNMDDSIPKNGNMYMYVSIFNIS